MSAACKHANAAVVPNSKGEPVRLNCTCGREWRVLPIEADVILVMPEGQG